MGFPVSPQVPFAFGGQVVCGYGGDPLGQFNFDLYGTGSIQEKFYLPTAETTLYISVPAIKVGSPSAPLVVSLYTAAGTLLQSVSVPASSIGAGAPPNWIPFQAFTGSFSPGYYMLEISSPGSTSTSFYQGFLNLALSWWDPKATGGYNPPPGGPHNSGWAVVWIQDGTGNDLAILPYGEASIGGSSLMFVAQSSFSVAAICPWLSDMDFVLGPYTGGWNLTDVTAGINLGTAPATQVYNSHGLGGVIPFQLPAAVNIIQGHTYRLSIVSSPSSVYGNLVRTIMIDPAKAALGGSQSYFLGEFLYSDFSLFRSIDYVNNHILDPFGGQDQLGVRFVSSGGTISSIHLKMYDGLGSVGNYTSGKPVTVSIFASNETASNGAAPTGAPLGSVTIDSGTIPRNGWFATPGFNLAMTAGTPYWVVWSSPTSTVSYVPQRCVSPFRFFVQWSANGGSTWQGPPQGPSEIAWHALLAGGGYEGSPYDHAPILPIDTANFVAQPFRLPQAATVNAVYVFAEHSEHLGTAKAAIYPDNGLGTGPNMGAAPLGTGSFDATYQILSGGIIIPFGNTTAALNADTKYWAVISSTSSGGHLLGAAYWTRPADPPVLSGFECLVSGNGGASWSAADPEIATALFIVGIDPGAPPPPQPTPTTLTLTAKQL